MYLIRYFNTEYVTTTILITLCEKVLGMHTRIILFSRFPKEDRHNYQSHHKASLTLSPRESASKHTA